MDQILTLLAGALLGMGVFAGVLWSGAQTLRQAGWLRWSHAALVAATLLAMASLQLVAPRAAAATGILMMAAALVALRHEAGWARGLTVLQGGFGAALIAGLPFGSGP